ncbi:hypothetical protein FQR65_LT12301 [Abscondita terminalis]|nr:hypothetical protein FQR65_LT12301 [Abscondita terminalis]
MFFLCIGSALADENQDLFSKFFQHDYSIKDYRVDGLNYNKHFIEDMLFVYRKYNRSTKAANITMLTRVDLTNNSTSGFLLVYKRYGNEFKTFGLSFSFGLCPMLEKGIFGFTDTTCGKILCPIIKHDYNVKDLRVDHVNYNKEFIQDLSIVYSKYNRTTKAGNMTILTSVDLTKNSTVSFLQGHKRYGNQFKTFGVAITFYHCQAFEENILGLGAETCGKISCPIKKNVRQSLCNWIPDYSRMLPFVPDGEYMVKYYMKYENQIIFSYELFFTVYREVKILK